MLPHSFGTLISQCHIFRLATVLVSLLLFHHVKVHMSSSLFHFSSLLPTCSVFAHALLSITAFWFPALACSLFCAPFSAFSMAELSSIADTDPANNDMNSEYGSDEGSAPALPIRPNNDFFSQVAQPASTPTIISTAWMVAVALSPSCPVLHASSNSTIRDARDASHPYSTSGSHPMHNQRPSHSASCCTSPSTLVPLLIPATSSLPISMADWAKFVELLGAWEQQSKLYEVLLDYKAANCWNLT